VLSQKMSEEGILVQHSAQYIGSKIIHMEAQYKDASNWLSQTGQGVLAEGGDVTDAVEKHCPFFYIIDPIVRDRPSINPLALSDELDFNNLSSMGEDSGTINHGDDGSGSNSSIEPAQQSAARPPQTVAVAAPIHPGREGC
jgi:hypothetical protein